MPPRANSPNSVGPKDCLAPAPAPGREYVASEHLAAEIRTWVANNDSNYHQLARQAGLSPRALRFILSGQRQQQTIFLADRLMIAMGKNIYHLPTQWR